MWAAVGDNGRLGAAKRRMLSLAERPSLPFAGAVEDMVVAVYVCVRRGFGGLEIPVFGAGRSVGKLSRTVSELRTIN